MRDYSPGKLFQITLRTALKSLLGRGGQHVCDFSEGGYMQSSTHVGRRFCQSQKCCYSSWGSDVSIKDFSDCLDRRKMKRNWTDEIFLWKYLDIWRPVLPEFLSKKECLIVTPPELLSGCARKVTNCSGYWYLTCSDRLQVPSFNWQCLLMVHKLDHSLGGISWLFCVRVLGLLVLGQAKISFLGSQGAIAGLGPIDHCQVSGPPVLLVRHGPESDSPWLLLPTFEVTLLLLLILYKTICPVQLLQVI